MCDPVENNLPRGRLGSLNRVLFRIPVKQDIQFRNLGNPAAVNFPAELDGELHESSLPPQESDKCFHRDQIRSPGAPGSDRSWAGSFLDGDLTGQFVPDPMRWRGESVKTTQDHSAQ